MPSHDITFCASSECPRRAGCERSNVQPRDTGRAPSMVDYYSIWGAVCGAYIPLKTEAG